MEFTGKSIGFALTGSHCTLAKAMPAMQELVDIGFDVTPILSEAVLTHETRFGNPEKWRSQVIEITGNEPMTTIPEVEPIGPRNLFDLLVVAPCTGNSAAKLANAITDSAVVMAMKAQLRNERPVILAIATNDGLGNNAKNLGYLINTPNIYFVPFGQDNPEGKPNSLVSRMDLIVDTVKYALEGKQIQPVVIEYKGI
ncbi:dipicolinate synthase subunit B [Orenia marismortui]|uniref:Dipicolinate synthase subunit B n=1 Tax=Orenia marismortui TaxID=46469 RepID=A0A4R8GLZ0_9FIRM|nr:dipicolinate synthase subunit B [Orenia marismortui]TDX46625.1 dipicolinate synthase subunit B [Orenia marismortui]